MKVLDATKRSREALSLLETFNKKIVGQESASKVLVDIVENFQAGFSDPTRPAGNALFLGPTGTGKTRVVEAMCEGLFGDARACIKIDAGEFQTGHEIAKLVGSPPGYLGHRETHPMLTQEALVQYHTDKLKLSVVLFDEIEKASDTLWNLLLGILDKATLSLGDNRKVDFRNVIIVMTSNLGSSQMSRLVNGGMGFSSQAIQEVILGSQIETVAKEAAKKKFSPEFFNRINHIAVFNTLTEEQIEKILNIELGTLQTRLLTTSKVKFFYIVKRAARAALLRDGFDRQYGARHLKRAIEKKILTPLARLVASGQVLEKDVIIIDDVGKPEFEFSILEASDTYVPEV